MAHNSVHFGQVFSSLVHLGLFGLIQFIQSTLVHFDLIQFDSDHFGLFRYIRSTSIHFGLSTSIRSTLVHLHQIWSFMVHLVHLSLFSPLRFISVHFNSIRSSLVYLVQSGSLQSTSIYFGPLRWRKFINTSKDKGHDWWSWTWLEKKVLTTVFNNPIRWTLTLSSNRGSNKHR